MGDTWYYTAGGQQNGPVTDDYLRSLLASGHVTAQDLAWRDGMAQWSPISLLPELLSGVPVAPAGAYVTPAPVPQLDYRGNPQYAAAALGYAPRREYGGFWIRFGAYIIDSLVLLIPNLIINQLVAVALGEVQTRAANDPIMVVSASLFASIPSMILDWLYYSLMESSSKQATLGKMACGLVVVDVHGRRISFGRATGRYFAKIISGLVCCIGYIVIGSDERKRGWHDSIAKTLVVTKNSLMTWG